MKKSITNSNHYLAYFIYDASLSYRTNEGLQQTSNRPIGHLSVMKDAHYPLV